jgi:hypothetical protein
MGKRSKSRIRQGAKVAAPESYAGFGGIGGGNGFIATQESPSRGRMVTFQEDTRKQLTPWARTILILKSRTLAENYGPAKSIWNLAELIGSLKPQANSGDDAWNELAEARFDMIANSPLSFDRAGKRNFYTWQPFSNFRRFIDGDFFSILTETEAGTAAIAGREGHQCGGGDGDGWVDGILADSNGRTLKYNFRALDGGKNYTLDPPAVHHHATWNTLGGPRGTPCLAAAINDMHDAMETKGFVKQGIKIAALMGLTRRADNSISGMPPGNYGAGAPVDSDNFTPAGAGYGTTPAQKRLTFEDVFSGGLLSSVPLDTIHDDRPHPNAEEFQKRLMREFCIGMGVPPEIMLFMDNPGGAEIRTHLEIFDRFIKAQHRNYLLPFCQRFWTYCMAKEIKAGRLPSPKGDFWRVRWAPPKSITADLGKMGNLMIELRRAGLTTDAAHYEAMGLDYESEIDQVAKEFALRMAKEKQYGLPPGSLTASLMPVNHPIQPAPVAA